MQRSGRKGHAMFRVVVQDSRRTPTSGKLVAQLGSFDPHAKVIIIDKEKAQFYLDNGAQPSDRVARLLGTEGLKLPKWVVLPEAKKRTVRNADKRRSTRPEEPVEAAVPEVVEPTPEPATVAEETQEAPVEVTPEVAETTEPEPETSEPEPAEEPAAKSEEPTPEVSEESEKDTK